MDIQVEQMIEDNKKLVYKIANSIYMKNKLFSRDDLIQVGFLALCKSGHKYDPTRGKVSTFITHCVRNDILKYIKSNKLQGDLIHLDNNSLKYRNRDIDYLECNDMVGAKNDLEQKIIELKMSGETNKSIAAQLNVSPNKISKILSTIKNRIIRQQNA
jgi:RNA polymerase sigma factor (sigma-70 family)